MTLERANLHNALAIWRDCFEFDQHKALSHQAKLTQEVATNKNDLVANLQAQVSKSSLRLGLVLTKKEVENKAQSHEQAVAYLQCTSNTQLVAFRERIDVLEKEKKELDTAVIAKQAAVDTHKLMISKQRADFEVRTKEKLTQISVADSWSRTAADLRK